MPQTYIKTRQLIWLLLLFSLFGALISADFAYAQTGSPPRSAGYVLGDKYYFTANTNEQSFLSCPAQRVTKENYTVEVPSSSSFRMVRSAYAEPNDPNFQGNPFHARIVYKQSSGVINESPSRKSEYERACRAEYTPYLGVNFRSKISSGSYNFEVIGIVCEAKDIMVSENRTRNVRGACISQATACSESEALCGYIEDHKNWFNKAPISKDLFLNTKENLSNKVTLLATDPDGPTPTVFEVFEQSEHGVASIQGNTLTFTPNKDWFGTTKLTYRAQDNKGAWSEPSTITITVTERKLVTDEFIYNSPFRSGVVKVRGVDEVPQAGSLYLEKDGQIIYLVSPNKTVVDTNKADYAYSLRSAPSGTYTLKADIYDNVGHVYTFNYGEITIYTLKTLEFNYNPVSRNGQVYVEDKGEILRDISIHLLDDQGVKKYELEPSCSLSQEKIRECTFNLNNAPEGKYEAKVYLIDNFDFYFGSKHGEILIDKTPAEITQSIPKSGLVEYISDIYFEVEDEHDPDVTINSITLFDDDSGKEQPLTWKKENRKVVLDHFSIFPSISSDLNYHIKIETIDHQLNKSELTASFYFNPKTFSKENLNVPALLHTFNRPDGSPAIISDKIRLSTGDVVKGQHDVIASLARDAKNPIKVNGFLVEPGQIVTVASKYDFDRQYGQLKLSIEPTSKEETNSQLLITIDTPHAPVGIYDLNFWKPAAKIESKNWVFKQVIDPINMVARSDQNSLCVITSNEQTARRSDPFKNPYCFIEWNELPDEVIPQLTSENRASLVGQAVELGTQKINYSLYMFNGAGEKVHIEDGEYEIQVESAFGVMALDAILPETPVLKLIDELNIKFSQVKGKSCSFTVDENQAVRSSSTGIKDHSLTCLFEWKELPPNMEQVTWINQPQARGVIPDSGKYDLKWELSIFSQKGVKVLLADQTKSIEVIEPPAPEIKIESKYLLEDGKTLVVPLNENYVGDVIIEGQNTNMDIEISRNEDVLYDENIQASLGYRNIIQRALNEDRNNRNLWGESIFSVKSSYELMPYLFDEKSFSAYSSPITGVKPFISSPNEFALNTETLPIHVDMLDQFSHRDPYDLSRMGEWQARIIRLPLRGEPEPISDFTDMENGHAEFDIDISDITDERTLRFTSEAKLIHNIENYERIETSPRVLILSLLRGEAIEADITTRTISGPAPLRGSFKIDLKEREMQAVTGDIVWELSKDGGITWEEYIPDERYKFIYHNTFETGTYHLRANITNRYSNISKYTETIEVIAYDKPELRIEGPTVRFVGDEVVLTATPGYETISEGQRVFHPIELEDTVIEWSTDNGRTFDHVGQSITLSSDHQQRIMVAARVRTTHAPEDDRYAFNVTKTSVEFKPIRPIRVRITGPSLVEVGKEYEFHAVTSLPYRGMSDNILGYFTLPNGDRVNGTVLTYTPTDEDLAEGRMVIRYDAWIEGYEDQGTDSTHTLRSSIWKYIWPDFGMHYQANANHAPALVTMTLRPMQAVGNRLEEPKYEWTLPEQIEMVDNSRDIIRKFRILEPGDHMVSVRITDARGNEAVVDYPISLQKADPFVLDLELNPSNSSFRAPLSLVVRPRISGGHPRDRFESFEFLVNGTPVDSQIRYAKLELDKGIHEIDVIMNSQMGVVTRANATVEVVENQVPICTVSQRESKTAFVYTADCTDPDGRLRSYEWQLGNRELVSGSRSITVGKHRLEGINAITLVGIDDSDGRSEPVIIPVHFSMKQEDDFSENVTN